VFLVTFFWVIVYLRWHPIATVAAVIAVGVAAALLVFGHGFVGVPPNDHFNVRALVQRESGPSEPASILDSLGLTETPDLSEADQNRRLRALRAIEERLEAWQGPK
jgi:hypothetical protein